ncbi:hypothetical protein XPA_008273 [Xanthoria parietina]
MTLPKKPEQQAATLRSTSLDFQLLHDVFRIRSADPIQVPLLAFPRSRAGDFEYFTADVLERFTSSAACCYAHANLSTVGPIDTLPHTLHYICPRQNLGVLVPPTAQRNLRSQTLVSFFSRHLLGL